MGPGCGFPVAAKKIKWLKISPKVFFVCKHFGTGVLIATAFVHVSSVPTIRLRCGVFTAKTLEASSNRLQQPYGPVPPQSLHRRLPSAPRSYYDGVLVHPLCH